METRDQSDQVARPYMASPLPWLRGPGRLDDDGYISLDLARAEEYLPLSQLPGPALELAAIRRPLELLAFVQRWGLLRHGPGATAHREHYDEWMDVARDVDATFRLYETLRRAERGDALALRRLRDALDEPELSEAEVIAAAAEEVSEAVSEGLVGTPVLLAPGHWRGESASAFGFMPVPEDLVGWIYYDLALFIGQKAPMSTCSECGRIFVVRDKRQRFCTTRCANRVRQRRWAEKRAKEKRL